MNLADPIWQKHFKALNGEKEDLKKLASIPLENIDLEYQADFKKLQTQIQNYLDSNDDYLFDSTLLHEKLI